MRKSECQIQILLFGPTILIVPNYLSHAGSNPGKEDQNVQQQTSPKKIENKLKSKKKNLLKPRIQQGPEILNKWKFQ